MKLYKSWLTTTITLISVSFASPTLQGQTDAIYDSHDSLLPPVTPWKPANNLQLTPRGTYSCDQHKPCGNGACCGKSGYCGYGPKYCGTTATSPNDVCWSNCDAGAACGQYAATPGTQCPLNVCCSEYGFCGTTSDFCGTGCQSNCNSPSSGVSGSNSQQRIMAYYESWSNGKQCINMNINKIPVESLTHLDYAFGYISPGSFQIGPMPGVDPSTFSDFANLKQKNPSCVISISLGGWSFNDNGTDTQNVFGDLVSSPSNRQKFISNLMTFLDFYGFDGVDIDWEYPGAPDRQPSQQNSQNDGANYVLLLQEIKAAFAGSSFKRYLSFTAPTSYWYLRWFPIKDLVDAADYVNFMTYDLHGVWDANDPNIGNQVLAATNLTEIVEALDLLWRNKVDPGKVNLGLAFYARTFELTDPTCTQPGCPFKGGGTAGGCTATSGILSYRELNDVLTSNTSIVLTYDQTAAVKYFTWNTNQWASFDDEETFQQKIRYANSVGLGGIFTWAVDMDDNNLDELRGMIYPSQLKATNDVANQVSYWEGLQPQACFVGKCGQSCPTGSIMMTDMKCPFGGKAKANLCCPIQSAPDPSTCTWRGGEGGGAIHFCNGQCHGGEVTLAVSTDGDRHCTSGDQVYCCPIPEVAAGGGINCGWKHSCSADQELMTFAGTFLEDVDYVLSFAGLVGEALAAALAPYTLENGKMYCCSTDEIKNWNDCSWVGNTDEGIASCSDNFCPPGIQVELTNSYFGGGGSCAPNFGRQLAWCCTPATGESVFPPVPLDYIFPNTPDPDTPTVFTLEVDDTWGTGQPQPDASDTPDDASFGFVVITSPAEVQVSLDKRDGSAWELFDCLDAESHEAQTVRMICTDDEDPESRCADIHKGYGAVGTIVEMPNGCGPGRYAVVKEMKPSKNQSLPDHIEKRSLRSSRKVYDLTFDYEFERVTRDFGNSQMRLDFSNEEGYWDGVVDRPGQKKKKRSEMEEFRQNRKRWLENEWRDAYHFGALDRDELHKRWFGSDVLSWLANLVGLGTASVTDELHHVVDEQVSVILIDQQFGPCDFAGGQAQGNLRASLDANIHVATTFGLTIIATLTFPPDLSNSYLYFKNSGKVVAKFRLDAVATWSYSSGDIPMIGLDNFPGASFTVPGIVTVGPNVKIYGAVDAVASVAGDIQAEVTVASWEIEQVYPQTSNYPVNALEQPNQDGTSAIGKPTVDASISASGEVQLHLKPTLSFGITFEPRWKVPDCSANLILDGYIIFHAGASASLRGDNSCPFTYGIDGGADMYAQLKSPSLFGWGGESQISIGSLTRRALLSNECPNKMATKRSIDHIGSGFTKLSDPDGHASQSNLSQMINIPIDESFAQHIPVPKSHATLHGDLGFAKRDTFSVGPLITIPESFIGCPTPSNDSYEGNCPVCSSNGGSPSSKREPDPDVIACPLTPPPEDGLCGAGWVQKRDNSPKEIRVPWKPGKNEEIFFSRYPSCPGTGTGGIENVLKWFYPSAIASGCNPVVVQGTANNGLIDNAIAQTDFANDHVFEAHFISDFLTWLCTSGSSVTYPSGPIAFPAGWTKPDNTWCEYVFGNGPDGDNANPPQGFQFSAYPGDNIPKSMISNIGEVMGGTNHPEYMAIYYKAANGWKGKVTQGRLPDLSLAGPDVEDPAEVLQNNYKVLADFISTANIFSYLQNNVIQPAWRNPSNNIETVCVMFDNSFWNSEFANNAPGIRLQRGAVPNGVTNWGLRTLWDYWIDNNLAGIDLKVSRFWVGAQQTMRQIDPSWVTAYMQGAAAASRNSMQFPKPNPGTALPAPGTLTTRSRYGMWNANGNNYGPVFGAR